MENVSIPLIGISNQTGETKLMKPNKNYKFKNTQSVTEIPAYEAGGPLDSQAAQGVLGAIKGIGPALGPWGMAAAGVATLLPTVANLFAQPDRTIVSGSPGQYQTGGEMNPMNPNSYGTPLNNKVAFPSLSPKQFLTNIS